MRARLVTLTSALALVLAVGCADAGSGAGAPDTKPDPSADTADPVAPDTTRDTTPTPNPDVAPPGDPETVEGSDVEEPDPVPPDPEEFDPELDPYMVAHSDIHALPRGWRAVHGHIHAHSAYSHDACDDHGFLTPGTTQKCDESLPIEECELNEPCVQQFREGLCQTGQDFMFLTDHPAHFNRVEYPEALLYRPEAGDTLIERDGTPVANRIPCAEEREVILSAGADRKLIAVGLERHVAETPEERGAVYGARDAAAIAVMKEAGALAVAGYSDEWDEDHLYELPLDGFEIYNPATNLRRDIHGVAMLVARMLRDPDALPVPELVLLPVFQENEEILRRWAKLVHLRPIFSYIATNAHQNVFQTEMADGERMDSYRRLFRWLTNVVWVPADTPLDDRVIKAAVGAGRHYGAFTMLGYPVGFDFHALQGETLFEMGSRIPDPDGVEFVVVPPRVYGRRTLGQELAEITVRVLKAEEDGSWTVLTESDAPLRVAATGPGVYRADVRIVPHHLSPWLGTEGAELIKDYLWIYANTIFVGVHTD